MKLTSNIHTHTTRCGHAYGTDEEYVLAAIDAGITFLGFSDHIGFPNLHQKGIRQEAEMVDDYVSSLKALKEKYKDQIEIHIGYEAEYYPEFEDYYKWLQEEKGIEFFILGQHTYLDGDKFKFYVGDIKDTESTDKYVDAVVLAIKSGMYKYVAHPDLFINGYQSWDEHIIAQSRRIIEAAIEQDIPLEINLGGARWITLTNFEVILGYHLDVDFLYPYSNFWKLVGEYKDAKVCIGVDAHKPENFISSGIEVALKYIDEYHLNCIDVKDLFKKD